MADLINLTIDGTKISVPKGTLIVDAAKRMGTDVPVFCYHPKMKPVGMCRMCLVEVGRVQRDRATGQLVLDEAGQPKVAMNPKLETACTTPVEEGMVVVNVSDKVKEGRDDIIEFLLTSHPLDCPICDKGGECPLQNLTMRHGPGNSRFIYDEKHHADKHVPLGTEDNALVFLDRERCIQCARCVRFQDEVVDDHVLGFFERGRSLEIVTFSDPGFDSKWSGNTTDICPVGALTTADFRFGARPWEMTPAASVCNQCPVGCNVTFSTRREAKSGGQHVIKRTLPRQNEQVNEIWICDKGRFGHHFVESTERLTQPLIRRNGELKPATWDEAYATIAEKFKAAGKDLLTLAGGRLSNEDLYALKTVTQGVGGTIHLDSAMGGGEAVQLVGVGKGTNFGSMGAGTTILVIASDLEEEAPVWWLRVKQATERGAHLIVANARKTKTDRYAKHQVTYTYGDEASVLENAAVKDALEKAQDAVILFGREGLDFNGTSALAQACANALIATNHYGKANNGLIAVWPHANDMGAWELGITPSASRFQALIGTAKALWVTGTDPVGDGQLGSGNLPFTVVQELFLTETAKRADVVLPAAAWAERDGTYTSGERRVQRFYPAVGMKGKPDFAIAAEIGEKVGVKLPKFASLVFNEIAKNVAAFAGLNYQELAKVEPQVPDVGGVDLYYGGTSYKNEQGLGVQLPSGAERGEAVAAKSASATSTKRDGLTLVATTVLYDKGTLFAPTKLLHPRVPQAHVELNADDAAPMGIKDGDKVSVTADGLSATVVAHVNGKAPKGVALMPASLGVPVPAGAVAVTIKKA